MSESKTAPKHRELQPVVPVEKQDELSLEEAVTATFEPRRKAPADGAVRETVGGILVDCGRQSVLTR